MPFYRKKPVIIEAIQFTGMNYNEIFSFMQGLCESRQIGNKIIIKTLEGNMQTDKDDWIIKGVKGEFYPCKPDIFEKTYELVENHEVRGA